VVKINIYKTNDSGSGKDHLFSAKTTLWALIAVERESGLSRIDRGQLRRMFGLGLDSLLSSIKRDI
jgi:hypothetical protein